MTSSDAKVVVPKLPEFIVKPSQDYEGWVLVTCQRKDCGHTFLVESKPWRTPRRYTSRTNKKQYTITTRACPYCFRPSRMPRRGTR